MSKLPRERLRTRCLKAVLIIFFTVLFQLTNASAITITYSANDLPDGPQGDLWQYDYTVDGYSFSEFEGFTIFFDNNLYDLLSPLSAGGDWDIFDTQPNAGLLLDGIYDAMALVNSPDLSNSFSVSFIWLEGNDSPSSQPFDIYDGNFNIIESGTTSAPITAPVPEPETLLLFFLGFIGIMGINRKITN